METLVVFEIEKNRQAVPFNQILYFFKYEDQQYVQYGKNYFFVNNFLNLEKEDRKTILVLFNNRAICLPNLTMISVKKITQYNDEFDISILETGEIILIYRNVGEIL